MKHAPAPASCSKRSGTPAARVPAPRFGKQRTCRKTNSKIRRCSFRAAGRFGSGIDALLAVGQADLLADLRFRQLVEPGKMLGRRRLISGKQVSTRQTEFSGQMKRIQRQTLFESRDRLIVTLRLQMELTEKVQRIGIAGIDPGDLFECIDGRRRSVQASGTQCRGYTRPARSAADAVVASSKNVARFGNLLAVEQCDTFV